MWAEREGTVSASGDKNSNIPDYQKARQNSDKRDGGGKRDVQTVKVAPSPVVRHPSPGDSSGKKVTWVMPAKDSGDRHYQPAKYGLVSSQAGPEDHGFSADRREYGIDGEDAPYGQYEGEGGNPSPDDREGYTMRTPPTRRYPLSVTPAPPHMPEDLRHWQQLHQDQLLHQHIEAQVLYDKQRGTGLEALYQFPPQDGDPHRWEPVRRAADNIIREKNMIIDKLKSRILELEDDLKVSDSKLRHALLAAEDRDDALHMRLQEMQFKCASLKTELIETRSVKNAEIDDLEVKLGAAEHEIQQLKSSLRNKDANIADIKKQVAEREEEAGEWRSKFQEMRDSHAEMRRKLGQVERYLEELPTAEESIATATHNARLKEENAELKQRVAELERRLQQSRQTLTARDFTISEMETKEQRLEEQVATVTEELEKLRVEGLPAVLSRTQAELAQCRADKERLAIDLEKAKKLLEATHRRLRQAQQQHEAEVQRLGSEASTDEKAMATLHQTIASQEETIAHLKQSIRELSQQNQDLQEHTLIITEQLSALQQAGGDHSQRLQRRFLQELGFCFSELRSLVQICQQRAEGQDPNMSLLLGVKAAETEQLASGETGKEGETIQQWLGRLADLRRDVDNLRGAICNKYAEDMAGSLTCASQ